MSRAGKESVAPANRLPTEPQPLLTVSKPSSRDTVHFYIIHFSPPNDSEFDYLIELAVMIISEKFIIRLRFEKMNTKLSRLSIPENIFQDSHQKQHETYPATGTVKIMTEDSFYFGQYIFVFQNYSCHFSSFF